MSQTVTLMEALLARLRSAFAQELAVELFPEQPGAYRLNHPRGALLLAYGRSRFASSAAVDTVFQERDLVFRLTLVFRQLNGRDGAIGYLDRVREHLAGWTPPHCCLSCAPQAEQFIGQVQGLWQYGLDIATRATQVQQVDPFGGPVVTEIDYEELT